MSDLISAIKAHKEKLSEDKLDILTSCIKEMQTLEKVIASTEEELSNYKKRLEEISRKDIPGLLTGCNLSSVTLSNGSCVDVKPVIKASIAAGKVNSVYTALMGLANRQDSILTGEQLNCLFKLQVIYEAPNNEQLESLKATGIPYDVKREIHYQTLNKLVKQLMAKGIEVPPEITVFSYMETKIK